MLHLDLMVQPGILHFGGCQTLMVMLVQNTPHVHSRGPSVLANSQFKPPWMWLESYSMSGFSPACNCSLLKQS